MGGTTSGGKKASQTNKERYDKKYAAEGGFYAAIGRLGGAKSRGGGFAKSHELAVIAGRIGGKASRRTTGLRGSR